MGTDSVIYIRTDGNLKIATGHFVRCLCIAQALESLGKSVCFLVSDTDSSNLLQDLAKSIFQGYSFSFEVKILKTAVYDNLELETEELKTLLNESSTLSHAEKNTLTQQALTQLNNIQCTKPVMLLDSYFVTQNYLSSLREFARVAYMDDLKAFDYNVDLVINYDVIPPSKELEYKGFYNNASSVLLGAQYTPLRRQFQNQNVSLRKKIQNILITTGGSDPYHFTETLISYLLPENPSVHYHVVVGKLFENTENLEKLAAWNPSVHLHYNVSNMAALMKQCDYAVSAAGTTLYELCALGIPAISFTMADNQMVMAETFAETGAVPYAGDIRPNTENSNTKKASAILQKITENPEAETLSVLDCIKLHLSSATQSFSIREVQHHCMRSLTDGNGASTIAHALCNLSKP